MLKLRSTLAAAAVLIGIMPLPAAAEVRLSRAATGHVTVPVVIAGRPFQFILDTGAEGSAIYRRVADTLGLSVRREKEALVGQTGSASLEVADIPELVYDGEHQAIAAAVLAPRADGATLDGVLGLDVLAGRALEIDLRSNTVRSLGERERAGLSGTRGKRVAGGLLAVPMRINGVSGTAVIDTGSRETRINQAFAAAAGLAVHGSGGDTTLYGATNEAVTAQRVLAGRIDLGGITLRRRWMRVVDLPVFSLFGSGGEPMALFGLDLLRRRRLLFDAEHMLVRLR